MTLRLQPLAELSDRAWQALVRELGVVDALRYLSQFDPGSGDYTAEREKLFAGETARSIIDRIKASRPDAPPNSNAGSTPPRS